MPFSQVEAALRGLRDPTATDDNMMGGDAADEVGAGARFDVRWPLGEPDILADAATHAARCRCALAQLRVSERGILRAEIDELLALVNAAELDPASKPFGAAIGGVERKTTPSAAEAAATIDQLERLCGRASAIDFEDAVTAFVRKSGIELLRARSRVATPRDEETLKDRSGAITTGTASALLRCVRLAQIGRAADAAIASVEDVVSVQLLCLRRWATLAAQPGSGGKLRGEVPSDALLKHALEQSAGAPLVVATDLVRAGCVLQAEISKDKTAQAVSDMQDAANRRGGVGKSGARSNAHQRVARLAAALCGWAPDATRALIRSCDAAGWIRVLEAAKGGRLWCGQRLPTGGSSGGGESADETKGQMRRDLAAAQRSMNEVRGEKMRWSPSTRTKCETNTPVYVLGMEESDLR